MPYALLLFATLLAACTSAPYLPPVHIPSERAVTDQAKPAKVTVASLSATTSPPLVYGKNAVGHRNFSNAKKILPDIFARMEEDFYCGCPYVKTVVNFASCHFQPRKNPIRAGRIEWEHVVPAWVLGHQRQCWQQGGRKNCTDTDPVYQVAEGDLNNLVPSIGEVNGDRNNFAYSAWTRQPIPMYGACQTIVDFKGRRVQPREEVRGRAARITLYMHETYKLNLSSQDKKLMCAWAKTYPVDDWERERNTRIVRWQGRGNPWVTEPAKLKAACG
jgi:deoxyribonuclease-1